MRVAHLLPRQRGNVAVDNYAFVNALLWMCRTGAPWRDLPACYGKWITVYQRFNRWSGNGAIERLFAALQEERIIAVEVRVPALDSTSVKVHRHAAGAPGKGGPQSVVVSRGGRNAKVHVVSDSESTLVEIHLSPGNERDAAHGRRSMAALGAFMGARLLMDRAHEGRSHPSAGRVVRPDAGRAAQEEPHGPMGLRQAGAQGAQHGRTRLQPHEALPQGRHPLRQARRHLPRQPPTRPHRHPTQKHQQNQLV